MERKIERESARESWRERARERATRRESWRERERERAGERGERGERGRGQQRESRLRTDIRKIMYLVYFLEEKHPKNSRFQSHLGREGRPVVREREVGETGASPPFFLLNCI